MTERSSSTTLCKMAKFWIKRTLFNIVDLPDPEGPQMTNGLNRVAALDVKIIFDIMLSINKV